MEHVVWQLGEPDLRWLEIAPRDFIGKIRWEHHAPSEWKSIISQASGDSDFRSDASGSQGKTTANDARVDQLLALWVSKLPRSASTIAGFKESPDRAGRCLGLIKRWLTFDQASFDQWRNLWWETCQQLADLPQHPLMDPAEKLALGELGWNAFRSWRHLAGADHLKELSLSALASGVDEALDSMGIVRARLWEEALPIWAPLLRLSDPSHSESPFDQERKELLSRGVEHLIRFFTPDRRLIGTGSRWPETLLEALFKHPSLNHGDELFSKLFAPVKKPTKSHRTPVLDQGIVVPVVQSDESLFSLLRTSWNSESAAIVVRHEEGVDWEWVLFGQSCFRGPWKTKLGIDGATIDSNGPWGCVCWQSDEDCDYLELQKTLEVGRTERQILLSRKDHFAVIAESFSEFPEGEWSYHSTWDIVPEGKAEKSLETREIGFRVGKIGFRIFPLGLADHRNLGTSGEFSTSENKFPLEGTMNVSFTKSGKGTGGYLAWLIDWSPARQKDPAEWRGLTTTENATVIPGDIAQGYRIKVGKSQWLIYRSMIPPEDARAVLSLHTSHETSINTVTPKGEIVPILMVDH